jgi:hypothetical protein
LPPVVELDLAGCERDHDGNGLLDRPVETIGRRVTSELVVSCPTRFDGHQVTYVGEAVGDLLVRDGGAWVLVKGDDYALEVGPLPGHRDRRGTNAGLSVWLPNPLSERLTGLGRPAHPVDDPLRTAPLLLAAVSVLAAISAWTVRRRMTGRRPSPPNTPGDAHAGGSGAADG